MTNSHVTKTAESATNDRAMHVIHHIEEDALAHWVARAAPVADDLATPRPHAGHPPLDTESTCLVREAMGWLLERLDEPYDLGRLSATFHVSSRTMLRRFAAETGGSPLHHLQIARVDAAKRSLQLPGSSVTEAMQRVGYTDPTSFRRLFVRHAGVTPGTYRASVRPKTAEPDNQDGRAVDNMKLDEED